MAEINAPFVLPGEEIRVPLKDSRPNKTWAAFLKRWGLSEDHIQIFGQPQPCIVEAPMEEMTRDANYFEANFEAIHTPGEDVIDVLHGSRVDSEVRGKRIYKQYVYLILHL